MEKQVREYSEIINSEDLASDKFWALEKRLRKDKRSPGVLLDMRRSMMMLNLVNLLNDGVISREDPDGFSNEITEPLKFVLGNNRAEKNDCGTGRISGEVLHNVSSRSLHSEVKAQ